MKTVNILGTEYTVNTNANLLKIGKDGMCKTYDKTIEVRTVEDMLGDADSAEIKSYYHREVMRHEIIHAFFTESGLCEYCDNEQLIDWIAMQFPKMQKVFAELGAL